MKQGLVSAGRESIKFWTRLAKLSNKLAGHMMLISGCYFTAIIVIELIIYRQESQWIGGIRPLYAKIMKSDFSTIPADVGLHSYTLDQVNALFLAGGAMLLFGGIKLATGQLESSSKSTALKPSII